MLEKDDKNFIEEETLKVEEAATDIGLQEKYINLLEELENKYI